MLDEARRYQQLFLNQHMAWLTAIRYQLRVPRIWENSTLSENVAFLRIFCITAKQETLLEIALEPYLIPIQINRVMQNPDDAATLCLGLQMELISVAIKNNYLGRDEAKTISQTMGRLGDLESRAFLIKNVPYPRSYNSMTIYFRNLFLLSLPITILSQLSAKHMIFELIPLVMIIGWVMMFLEKVGQNIMYPFESGPNDVPITTISKHIEIVMKKLLGMKDVPEEIVPKFDIAL